MNVEPEENAGADIEVLVRTLAKTFQWSGLYGPGPQILARRMSEMHAALTARGWT